MGWIFIVLGLLIRTPMTVMTLGFTFLFPLVFASNIMVDPATMPGWLRAFVEVNPVSLMTTAMRGLMSGGVTALDIGLALVAPVVLTLLLAPVTLWLYLAAIEAAVQKASQGNGMAELVQVRVNTRRASTKALEGTLFPGKCVDGQARTREECHMPLTRQCPRRAERTLRSATETNRLVQNPFGGTNRQIV